MYIQLFAKKKENYQRPLEIVIIIHISKKSFFKVCALRDKIVFNVLKSPN
jgi:hypothetical protein